MQVTLKHCMVESIGWMRGSSPCLANAASSGAIELGQRAGDRNVELRVRDLAERRRELAAVDPVRLVPEIGNLGQLTTQRHDRPQRMDEPPAHRLDPELAAGRPGDRGSE